MQRSVANRRIYIAVAVGAVLVMAGMAGLLGPVRWLVDRTLVPMMQNLSATGTGLSEGLANFTHVRDLARDNKRLERENAELRQRVAADAETRRDNEILRRQLGLEVAVSTREVGAEVVAFQPDSYRQFVTINKGSAAGIKPGMAAMSDGLLVGLVSEVSERTSKISLVNDPEFKLAAKDQDTGAVGVLRGQLGSGLLMEKIGQTERVAPGDTITTAGLGELIPGGLLVGQVQAVNTHQNAIFQSAQVATPFKLNQLRFVFVVMKQ